MPSTPDAKVRVRNFKPKRRTGCKTCKERRIKCDEQHPICQRCVSAGRICQGYDNIVVAQAKEPKDGTPGFFHWVGPCSPLPEMTPREQSAFHTFRHLAVETLSSVSDARLWERSILAIAMHEPAVRDAAIAFGALCHVEQDSSFALKHYGKAMQALQQLPREQHSSLEMLLAACILFVAFEFRQGAWTEAVSHATGGLKIIRELKRDASTLASGSSDVNTLAEAFERLDVQISLFTSSRVQLTSSAADPKFLNTWKEPRFVSVAQAGRSLNPLLAGMRELVSTIEDQRFSCEGLSNGDVVVFERQALHLLDLLRQWHVSMAALLIRLSTSKDRQMAKALQMQYLCCRLFLSNCLTDGRETRWDSYLPDFQELLDLAQNFLDSMRSKDSPLSHGDAGFTLDMGVIPPTYFVVMKCRDPSLRRRAVNLLESCKHQEGAWNGPLTAKMARAIMELEERDLTSVKTVSDVPEPKRFYQAWYDLSADGPEVVYCKRKAFEADGRWLHECLSCA